jgi:hypothetical protein
MTRVSNPIQGVLKTFGLLSGAMRDCYRKVEAAARSDVALIVRPMLIAWRQFRIIALNKVPHTRELRVPDAHERHQASYPTRDAARPA